MARTPTASPHAAVIKAWADGELVQVKNCCNEWDDCTPVGSALAPRWSPTFEYRIKPKHIVPMERPQPKEMIAALNKARYHLFMRRSNFICDALYHACLPHPNLARAQEYLRAYISKALGGHPSLGSWRREHDALENLKRTRDRKARLDWITWMIEGLEKEVNN